MSIVDIFNKLFGELKTKDSVGHRIAKPGYILGGFWLSEHRNKLTEQTVLDSLDEEKVKLEAYFLWEKNPNEGDSEYYWNKAKQNLEKQYAKR